MATDELWQPDHGSPKASPTENARVRQVVLAEKVRLLGDGHPLGHKCSGCGTFRGDLARSWVDVAVRSQGMRDVELKVPGAEWRQDLREGEDELERRVDAARTRLRQLERGHNEFDWVLVGVETTIADRNGWAYPSGAYRSQGKFDLGEDV